MPDARMSTRSMSSRACVSDEFRRDRHVPAALVGEGGAFYGIFLRHEHRQIVAEIQIARLESVMIGQRMLVQRESRLAQHVEEPLRIADGRHGVHAGAAKTRRARATTRRPTPDAHRPARMFIDEMRARRRTAAARTPGAVIGAVDDHRIHAPQAPRRLAQRSARQQAAVAEAALAVDDHDLAIAHQRQVLKSVVADHDVGAIVDRGLRRGDAVAADEHRRLRAARQQQRLVAHFGGRGCAP